MKIQGLAPIYTNKLYANNYQPRVNLAQKADTVSFTGISTQKNKKAYEEKLAAIKNAVSDIETAGKEGEKHFNDGINHEYTAKQHAKKTLEYALQLKEEAYADKNNGGNEEVITFNNGIPYTVKTFKNKNGLPTACFFSGDRLSLVREMSEFCIHSYAFVDDKLDTYEQYKRQAANKNCQEIEVRLAFDEKGQLRESATGYKYFGEESVKSDEVGFYENGKLILYITDYDADENGLRYGKSSAITGTNPVEYSIGYEERGRKALSAKRFAPCGAETYTEKIVTYDYDKGEPARLVRGYREKDGEATCESFLSLNSYGKSGNSSKYAEGGKSNGDNDFSFNKEFLFSATPPIKFFIEKR